MGVKRILIILVLNIALPTLDTVTDINLVYALYRGAHYCEYDGGPDYKKCLEDPLKRICLWTGFRRYRDYEECEKDPVVYCSIDENNENVCGSSCQWVPHDRDNYGNCKKDPNGYCSNDTNNLNFCRFAFLSL